MLELSGGVMMCSQKIIEKGGKTNLHAIAVDWVKQLYVWFRASQKPTQ